MKVFLQTMNLLALLALAALAALAASPAQSRDQEMSSGPVTAPEAQPPTDEVTGSPPDSPTQPGQTEEQSTAGGVNDGNQGPSSGAPPEPDGQPAEGDGEAQGDAASPAAAGERRIAESKLANALPEIFVSLDRLENLVLMVIAVSLASLLVNPLAILFGLRRRESRKPVQGDPEGGVIDSEASAPPLPAKSEKQVGPSSPPQHDPAPPRQETRRPVSAPIQKPEEPPASPSSEPDEFALLPHAAVGRALSQLHRALPALARSISDPRQQDRFFAELDLPLKARIGRFKDATRQGDAYLKEHWIEQDLVTTLNTLSQMLSSVIEERFRGRRGNRQLEEELSRWLYERLAPVCQEEGWFVVESILPFMTRFDPKIHHSVGSVALDGADNLIVTIKAIGRRDVGRGFVTHKAEVIVGR